MQASTQTNVLADMSLPGNLPVSAEARLSVGTYLEALERCAHLAGDPHFALRVGSEVPIQNLGLAGQAILGSDTLRDALSTTQEVMKYFQSTSALDISVRNGRCRVRYIHGFDIDGDCTLDVQLTMGALANIVSQPRHGIDPETIIFYPDAKSGQLMHIPGIAKAVSSTTGIIEFDERAMFSLMPHGNPDRSEILRKFADSNPIETATDLSMTETVMQLVRASMGITRPSQPQIAAILGMNVKALHRALRAERTTFRRILERTSLAVAIDDLSNGRSVTETAMKLGYDHPQNFTTAFRRWCGHSPSSV